ncbi:2,3-bisphosphoglycerate-dependent phosphoglycerate mutase [Melia azedarach]|uniref:2,3-bisphosphoglycerate-dependent phosphoglycerate mutase n=1 Tax=Melia azedarach TaxID=155640 RepID=A0ACC1XMK3_MELAZ|nr:2,3-bisphosphoglycerate-dependent phosphoglycerate mutase [Melia azedarach]
MTQKGHLFKGQQKKKTVPPNRHGKTIQNRKGKRFVKPSKITKEMDVDRELTKFINHCNEVKAATLANKEGGQLSIIKPSAESSATAANKKENQSGTAEA